MNFKTPLIKGKLIKRYKRFLADIALDDGQLITAHCPNPGAMLGLVEPGNDVWVSAVAPEIPRKLRYTWQIVMADNQYVGVNTNLPNDLVEEAIKNNNIPELAKYDQYKREVKYGQNSRIDFLLNKTYLEVKYAHLKRNAHVQFPDSVTARGSKHLAELINMVESGFEAMVIYVAQRDDCDYFSLAADLDPHYAAMALQSQRAGVKHLCYGCKVSPQGIYITKRLEIVI